MAEILQYVPFDESGGTLAKDLSGNDYDFTTTGKFEKGKKGNSLKIADEFPPTELIGNTVVDFNEDFTYTFWFKTVSKIEGVPNTWLLYKFPAINNYLYLDAKTPGTLWTYVAIMQQGTRVVLAINGKVMAEEEFPEDWGMPTGFVMLNDSEGELNIDELIVYNGANLEALKPPATPMEIIYKLAYRNFKEFGVYVKQGDGFFDALKMKEPFRVDWPDFHGDIIDLTSPRYEARQLSLECFIYSSTVEEFETKVKQFFNLLYGANTKRLSIDTGSFVYNYEVYMPAGAQVKKKWRPTDMIGEFTLQLVEPQPIKRSILFIRSSGNTTASVTLTSSKPVSIYWGDGTVTDDVYGTSINRTHAYGSDGQYYI
jgi:hypothetical protein